MSEPNMKSSVEALADLGVDEESINHLIASTGAEVPTVLWPTAKLIAADVLLLNIFAAEMAPGADFQSAIEILGSVNNPDIVAALPELAAILMDLCDEEAPAVGLNVYRARIALARTRLMEPVES